MSIETSNPSTRAVGARPALGFRPGLAPWRAWPIVPAGSRAERPMRLAVLGLLAAGFVLIGGASLDLGPIEARLGLATGERFGPLGQNFGGWEPSVWPGQLVPSKVWAWFEEGMPTANSVRWPAAIAGVLIGLLLARRAATLLGGRAALLVGACWFGSIGLMDRSAGAGIDLLTGLATVAALDRLLARGSDLVAGGWLAVAFLLGGWPPVAFVFLATVVLGRLGASLSWRLAVPPAVAAAGWSVWALGAMQTEAWVSALALPLAQRPEWSFVPGLLALGLPWSLLALLPAGRRLRESWSGPSRAWVIGWGQVVLIGMLAGTVVPGLALAARVPALAGLAVAAAAGCDRIVGGLELGHWGRRWLFGSTLALVLAWALIALLGGGYLAAAVPYYRFVTVSLAVTSVLLTAYAILATTRRDGRRAVVTLFALAVCLRLAHWGYYVPEWNYRRSQGPWGRAVGQWVPPGWPIFTFHNWPADLAFATGHPVRQLASERHLEYQPGQVKFVLLHGGEFANWPSQAPALLPVAQVQDEFGTPRVLARTHGDLPWIIGARARGVSLPDEN